MDRSRNSFVLLSAGLLAAAVGAVASCTLGPNYARLAVDVPATYKSATQAAAGGPNLQRWWTLFNDEDLTGLEDAALEHNPDLKAAMARVAQARATASQVESQFYPQITLDPSISWAITPRGKTGSVTRVPFDLGYEIDIWGQVKRSLEAANATTQSTADQYGVVELTMEADVAQDYFNLRSLEQQDRIFTENVSLTREQLDLTKRKLQAGIVGQIDVSQAQTQLDELITQQVDIRRQRADTEHALAILTGKAPAEFSVVAKEGTIVPPVVPPELPAEILRRRPDVASAEQNLVAANAQVGVAITNFYPTVRISGAAGLASVNVEHVLDWQSALLQIGPSVSVPVFEGGRLTAELAQARARYDELVATYRGTILAAFRDVETSMTDVHMYGDALDAQHQAVDSAREYLRLSRLEYDQGLESYLQLLDADRTLLTNQITESQLTNQRLTATVLLIKALGGGWDPQSTPATSPAPRDGP